MRSAKLPRRRSGPPISSNTPSCGKKLLRQRFSRDMITAPEPVLQPHWRLRDIVLLAPKIVLTALLILAIGDLIVGVFLRYVVVAITDWLDLDPVNFFWVEEVGEYSLAWMTMIGAAIGVAERAHFTLHLITHHLPVALQRAIH